MKNRAEKPQTREFIAEFEAKQRNIVFPDTLKNSRSVDEYLLKGSPDAPLVQRVGAWIFGIAFIIVGLALLGVARERQIWPPVLLSIISLSVGLRVILSGFRKRKSKAVPDE